MSEQVQRVDLGADDVVTGTSRGRLEAFIDQFATWEQGVPRLAITLDTDHAHTVGDTIRALAATPGVVDVQLVRLDEPEPWLRAVLAGYRLRILPNGARDLHALVGAPGAEQPEGLSEPMVALMAEGTHTALLFAHAGDGGFTQTTVDLGDLVGQALRHEQENHGGDGPGTDTELGLSCPACNRITLDVDADSDPACPDCRVRRRLVTVAYSDCQGSRIE